MPDLVGRTVLVVGGGCGIERAVEQFDQVPQLRAQSLVHKKESITNYIIAYLIRLRCALPMRRRGVSSCYELHCCHVCGRAAVVVPPGC